MEVAKGSAAARLQEREAARREDVERIRAERGRGHSAKMLELARQLGGGSAASERWRNADSAPQPTAEECDGRPEETFSTKPLHWCRFTSDAIIALCCPAVNHLGHWD